MMNRWAYMLLGILFFVGLLTVRNYFILQTSGTGASGSITPSVSPSGVIPSSGRSSLTGSSFASTIPNIPTSSNAPNVSSSTFQIPSGPSSSSPTTGNTLPQPAVGIDPTTLQHTLSSGGRADIAQIGPIITSQQEAYTGDDITFTVTIKNTASYKKFVRQLCWESNEGNFGCSPGFNLDPGQVFSISNSGRFVSSGTKSVWVTWTQDSTNFYMPVDSQVGRVQIL